MIKSRDIINDCLFYISVASLYMTGDCSFTIACHVDSELTLLKITPSMGDFFMVKNLNSWCG